MASLGLCLKKYTFLWVIDIKTSHLISSQSFRSDFLGESFEELV